MRQQQTWRTGGACLITGLLATSAAMAQDATGGTYFGVGLGYVSPDSGARDAEEGYGAQLLFGWKTSRYFNLELAANFATLEDTERAPALIDYFRGDDGTGSTSRIALGGDLIWQPRQGFSPFLLAGMGAAYNKGDPDNDSGIDLYMNFGVGLLTQPLGSYGVRLRAEWRYVSDGYVDKPKDRYYLLGIHFPLRRGGTSGPSLSRDSGSNAPAPILPPRVVPSPDAPASTSPPLPPLPQVDDDGDGIFTAQDRCPDTLPGLRVDQFGCAVEGSVTTIAGLSYITGSARLEASSTPALVRVLAALEGQPSMRIELGGHTDSIGEEAANLRLSEQRAQAVERYLEERGIEDWRIAVMGYGALRPIADNATEEGRARNRRVEVRVLSP